MPMQPKMECEESNQSMLEDQPGAAKRAKLEASETDRLLNFATAADEFELSLKRHKLPRDPMSHRIIEKRRRDRMNNCLADLSRLIPSSYHKQGQGRIEKTEIIEMAIKHINLLQQLVDDVDKKASKEDKPLTQSSTNEHHCCATKFYMGFKEAQDEVMRFLVEVESINVMDAFCKKIMHHLEKASKKFITEPVLHRPLPSDVEKTVNGNETDNSQSAFLQRSAFYPTTNGGSAGQGDKSLNMESKHRDKHLRSLLAEQQQQHSMVSSINGSSNMSETSSGSNGLVPLFSYTSHLHSIGATSDQNGMGSSGYMSDLSNMEKTSPTGSTSSRDNVYKFKHNITKRFSQEGHHHHSHHHMQHHHHKHGQPSDTSSSTSSRDLEDDQSHLKWKSSKHKTRHGVTSGLYQDEMEGQSGGNNSANSDEFNSDSVSREGSRRRNSCKTGGQNSNHNSENNSSSSVALPGFILHPQGTHYMPISVHNTNIAGLFENASEHDGPMVFHPISIPVHFRQPVISMPNITICTHISSQRRNDKE